MKSTGCIVMYSCDCFLSTEGKNHLAENVYEMMRIAKCGVALCRFPC